MKINGYTGCDCIMHDDYYGEADDWDLEATGYDDDCDLSLDWCPPDERTGFTEALFDAVGSSDLLVVAPALWAYESRNTGLMGLGRPPLATLDKQLLVAAHSAGVAPFQP